jgi:hypothetical protein
MYSFLVLALLFCDSILIWLDALVQCMQVLSYSKLPKSVRPATALVLLSFKLRALCVLCGGTLLSFAAFAVNS